MSYQEQIQEEFEENSEIQLKGFLKVTSNLFSSALPVLTWSWWSLVCLSSGGEVQGGEWSSATDPDSVDEERSAQ